MLSTTGLFEIEALTAGVGVDLPILVEWSAGKEVCEDAGYGCPDDHGESDGNANAIRSAKSILCTPVSICFLLEAV